MDHTNRMATVPQTLSMFFMLMLLLAFVPLVLAGYPHIDQSGGLTTVTRNDNSDDGLKDVACAFAEEAIHKVLGDSYPIRTCNKKNLLRHGGYQAVVKLSIKKNKWPGDYDCVVVMNYNNENGVYTYRGNNAEVHCEH